MLAGSAWHCSCLPNLVMERKHKFAVASFESASWFFALLSHCSCWSLLLLQVQLKRRGDDEKYMARVLAIGTECDLALLSGANHAGVILLVDCG